MSSVRAIARRAGVSPATVSRVMNNHPMVSAAIRSRVVAASNLEGYVPLVGRKPAHHVALVYTGEVSIGSPFDAAVLEGIAAALDSLAAPAARQASGEPGASLELMLLSAARLRQGQETYTQALTRRGVRGVLLRTTTATRHICEAIAAEGYPAVVIGDRFGASVPIGCVHAESADSSRSAVDHLLALGHRRIAMCMNVVDDSDHHDRLAGYRAAMESAGAGFDERLVFRLPANREGGAQFVRRLVALRERPTAVFLSDPMTVVGVLAAARRVGLGVPGDLSVVGFDDRDVRLTVSPELTAVCQDAQALGREAVMLLREALAAPGTPPGRRVLRTWLEVRESTARSPVGAGQTGE